MGVYTKRHSAVELQRKRATVSTMIQGRDSASSSNIAASYDLPIDQVQALLRLNGVRDDG